MKINIKNIEKIKAIVAEKEGKAKTRLFPVKNISGAIEKAEKKLEELGIPKKAWKGCRVFYSPGKVANSYDYNAKGSFATFEYSGSNWFLIYFCRKNIRKTSYGSLEEWKLFLSEEAFSYLPQYYDL